MKETFARLRNIVTALAVIMLGLVFLAGPSTAADGDTAADAGCTWEWSRTIPQSHDEFRWEKQTRTSELTWEVGKVYVRGEYQRYSWAPEKNDPDVPPPFPDPRWQANTSNYWTGHEGEPIEQAFKSPRGSQNWYYWDTVHAAGDPAPDYGPYTVDADPTTVPFDVGDGSHVVGEVFNDGGVQYRYVLVSGPTTVYGPWQHDGYTPWGVEPEPPAGSDTVQYVNRETTKVDDDPIVQQQRAAEAPDLGNYPDVPWVKDESSIECPDVQVTVEAPTFADNTCATNSYLPPSISAQDVPGTARTVTGLGANDQADPGETVTVTYAPLQGYEITDADPDGTKSFPHTFPADPNEQLDCEAPVDPCPDGDFNGAEDGCGTPPDPCPGGDFNGPNESGCGTPPPVDPCPEGDFNGDEDGCGTPPPVDPCPNGDLNGDEPGCDAPPPVDPCPEGDFNGDEDGCGTPPPVDPCPGGDLNGPDHPGCARPDMPEPTSEQVPGSETGCEIEGPDGQIGGTHAWVDEFTTNWVYDQVDNEWDPVVTGPVRISDTFTPFTDDEYFAECATPQPPAEVRQLSGGEESCELGGEQIWADTYVTPYVWNAETRSWEPGAETVVHEEEFLPWSEGKIDRLCTDDPEIAGEQEDKDPPANDDQPGAKDPEVKGSQASVPTAVDAGIGDEQPLAAGHNPLWLLAVGGGIGLIGFAGLRRREPVSR